MGLYKLFSCNAEIQYKSYFLSKAMFFTMLTTAINIILPFIIAHRSKGFWLQTGRFYEQPLIQFTYEYLLVAETELPGRPIVCGELPALNTDMITQEENCAGIQVQEFDYNDDGKYDMLDVQFYINIPSASAITSLTLILGLDFQLQTVCPLHMQSLAVLEKTFSIAPSAFIFNGDIQFHQISNLFCISNVMDVRYNKSVLSYHYNGNNKDILEFIFDNYFQRKVITKTEALYTRTQDGNTGTMNLKVKLRIPETQIRYLPSLLQELKWAWPQYLSLVVIFYWILNKIKKFVFNHRLLMAWEIIPWKKL